MNEFAFTRILLELSNDDRRKLESLCALEERTMVAEMRILIRTEFARRLAQEVLFEEQVKTIRPALDLPD